MTRVVIFFNFDKKGEYWFYSAKFRIAYALQDQGYDYLSGKMMLHLPRRWSRFWALLPTCWQALGVFKRSFYWTNNPGQSAAID